MSFELPQLDPAQVRVLGSLVEKDLATPEYYPLSLNALVAACNQKSNRDPVLQLGEEEVTIALERLRHLGFVRLSAGGGRVDKFVHSLEAKLSLSPEEMAVVAELLLRGPQTVGELRGRASRMREFADLQQVESVLRELAEREPPLVTELPRQPGRKENRFCHLLAEPPAATAAEEAAAVPTSSYNERLAELESEVATLREEVAELKREFAGFRSQFE